MGLALVSWYRNVNLQELFLVSCNLLMPKHIRNQTYLWSDWTVTNEPVRNCRYWLPQLYQIHCRDALELDNDNSCNHISGIESHVYPAPVLSTSTD